jgi:hypothetical protein
MEKYEESHATACSQYQGQSPIEFRETYSPTPWMRTEKAGACETKIAYRVFQSQQSTTLRFRRTANGTSSGGMGSDVQNSKLTMGEFSTMGERTHVNSEFGTSEPVRFHSSRLSPNIVFAASTTRESSELAFGMGSNDSPSDPRPEKVQ